MKKSDQIKALAKAQWGDPGRTDVYAAQRAIDANWVQRDTLLAELEAQGWTPPPDPWEVIARELWYCRPSATDWDPSCADEANLLDAVRRLLTEDEARAIAKRIEGES